MSGRGRDHASREDPVYGWPAGVAARVGLIGEMGGIAHMDKKFAAFVETLAPKLTQLLAMPPLRYGDLPLDIVVPPVICP